MTPLRPPEILLLDETTVFRLLANALRKRETYILAVMPNLPGMAGPLERLKSLALARGWARDAFGAVPGLDRYRDVPWFLLRTDAYDRVEASADRHFATPQALAELGEYGLPWAHVCNNRVGMLLPYVLALHELLGRTEFTGARLCGVNADLAALVKAFSGRGIQVRGFPSALVNSLMAIVIAIFGVVWCLKRLKPRPAEPEPVLIGIDFVPDKRLISMMKDILGDLGRALFLMRNRGQVQEAGRFGVCLEGLRRTSLDEGVFSPAQALAAIGMSLKDGWRLWRRALRMEPVLFKSLGALAVRRAMVRALANRYRFSFFFGRDDYNVEHILRSQELRKRGTVNMGISHGLPAPVFVEPVWRHIDFDRYYVFGAFQADRNCYGRSWPGHMEVVPVGTFGLSRVELKALPPIEERPKDIVCFINIELGEDRILDVLKQVALAFPDKQVLLRPKPGASRAVFHAKVSAFFEGGPENVRIYLGDDDTYPLMGKARYALSTASTVAVEAIQLGLCTFIFDLHRDQPFYFRDFPGLCVGNAEEIVARIRAIDGGHRTYPRNDYARLVDLSGRCIYDVIAADIGLAPVPA